jgi:hypothetical protein
MERLKDKIAIVTGSSSGFGRAIAKEFAKEGAKVVCSDIRREARKGEYDADKDTPTDEAIRNMGGESIFVKCDVSKLEEVKSLVKAAVDKFGRLDITVNNAGVFTRMGAIHEKTEKELDFTMNVNFKGTWNGCQQAIIQFRKQGGGGKIINVVSLGGVVGLALVPAYCASKGAVALLTKQLAIDYGPDKINVNGICPSYGITPMCREYYEFSYDNPKWRAKIEDVTPLKRWVKPEEVAKLCVFLASSDSDYISGDLIPIDGGYLAK